MDSKVFFHVNKLNTFGDYVKRSSNRPITRRAYREFEYMPELQDKNPIKELFNAITRLFKNIFKSKISAETGHFEDTKHIHCTTIEI